MEHIGKVIQSDAEIRLGSGVIALLEGVDDHVHERVEHKDAQKEESRQKIQPALETVHFHGFPLRQLSAMRSSVSMWKASTLAGRRRKRTVLPEILFSASMIARIWADAAS